MLVKTRVYTTRGRATTRSSSYAVPRAGHGPPPDASGPKTGRLYSTYCPCRSDTRTSSNRRDKTRSTAQDATRQSRRHTVVQPGRRPRNPSAHRAPTSPHANAKQQLPHRSVRVQQGNKTSKPSGQASEPWIHTLGRVQQTTEATKDQQPTRRRGPRLTPPRRPEPLEGVLLWTRGRRLAPTMDRSSNGSAPHGPTVLLVEPRATSKRAGANLDARPPVRTLPWPGGTTAWSWRESRRCRGGRASAKPAPPARAPTFQPDARRLSRLGRLPSAASKRGTPDGPTPNTGLLWRVPTGP